MAVYILRDTPRNAITDNAQARLKLMWNMQNTRKLIPINTEVKRNVRMFIIQTEPMIYFVNILEESPVRLRYFG